MGVVEADAAAAGDPGGSAVVPPSGHGREPRSSTPEARGRLTGAEAARTHLVLVVGLGLCAAAFWFEVRRALGGNGLSWAYVFEWPLFAAFAVYMWWNVLHGGRARRTGPARPQQTLDPRYAGMLEAWNAHQRELRASVLATEGDTAPGAAAERGTEAPAGD